MFIVMKATRWPPNDVATEHSATHKRGEPDKGKPLIFDTYEAACDAARHEHPYNPGVGFNVWKVGESYPRATTASHWRGRDGVEFLLAEMA